MCLTYPEEEPIPATATTCANLPYQSSCDIKELHQHVILTQLHGLAADADGKIQISIDESHSFCPLVHDVSSHAATFVAFTKCLPHISSGSTASIYGSEEDFLLVLADLKDVRATFHCRNLTYPMTLARIVDPDY